ncbi:betaine/proline/choline family ABC transporter ATP-binding protein [Dehalococcoidales bacterium]|nr:betaine/proline/choline family ABC transporter ATP-binding protein [Dehalococcoidales bacterium]MCL0091843.1 betaine/proline/choline family ABC transporter ATP-binding protein [Dehalococcoidales bacterium]
MIKLDRVTKVYPDGTEAVKEVSFEVKKGELCVLLGPSGCGKTTTMKMINRLLPITAGKIYIDGRDNTEMDEDELRRNIGYAIQEIGLFPHMTVGQNIETVPALKGWSKAKRRKRAEELLELMRMEPGEFIDKYPSELSGGQRQRVGVARALGADPPILLMDEPFGAIDPITRVRLQDEFLRIQREIRKTIIFVTHDIYEAIKMGDKITLMNEGQLVQYDTPYNLLYRPKNEFVENFVGADRALKGLQLLRVKEVIRSSPPTVKVDEMAVAVRRRMEQEGIDWLAVVNVEGKFLGWVDKANLERGDRVGEVMNPSAMTATVDMVLNEALSLMLSSRLNTLAVVNGGNRLQGVLSFDAIQKALSEIVQRRESE